MDLKWIKQHGKKARGRQELIDYLEAHKKLSPKRAILAGCYECTGCYDSGRVDCKVESCPLHPHMPYGKEKQPRKRVLSEKQTKSVKKLTNLSRGARKNTSGKK